MKGTEPTDWYTWGRQTTSRRTRWPALLVSVVVMSVPSYGRQVGPSSSPPIDGAPARLPRSSEPTASRLLEVVRRSAAGQPSRIGIAKALAQLGDRDGARAALQQELQFPDGPSLMADIAEVQAYVGDRDAALSTLLMARQACLAEDNPYTLGKIATAQLRLGDRVAGRDTFEQAVRSAKALEGSERAHAMQIVLRQEADADQLAAALEAAASIDDLNERIDVLSELEIERRKIDTQLAERFLRLIDIKWTPEAVDHVANWRKTYVSYYLKIDVLVALALAEASANHQARARAILQRAMRVAVALKVKSGRYRRVGQVTKALVKAGATDEATRIANTFGEKDRDIWFLLLSSIAEAHTEIGDQAAALNAWNDALQVARTGTKKLRALMEIASAQIASGDREVALRTLDEALMAAGSITDDDRDAHGLPELNVSEIAVARARANDIIGAIQLAGSIPNTQIAGDALASIAKLQAASGDVRGALDTADMISPPNMGMISDMSDKTGALLSIIRVQAREGDMAGALATADRLSSVRAAKYLTLMALAQGLEERGQKGNGTGTPRHGP